MGEDLKRLGVTAHAVEVPGRLLWGSVVVTLLPLREPLGSVPALPTPPTPRSNRAQAPQLLGLRNYGSPRALETLVCNKRSPGKEKSASREEPWALRSWTKPARSSEDSAAGVNEVSGSWRESLGPPSTQGGLASWRGLLTLEMHRVGAAGGAGAAEGEVSSEGRRPQRGPRGGPGAQPAVVGAPS